MPHTQRQPTVMTINRAQRKIAVMVINREARKTRKGYRLWETTTEGSPISPFFPTLDALCTWAAEHATVFADRKASADEWHAVLIRPKPDRSTVPLDGISLQAWLEECWYYPGFVLRVMLSKLWAGLSTWGAPHTATQARDQARRRG